MKTIGIIGATGAVGREIISLLETRQFPLKKLHCFASEKSKGETVQFKKETIPLQVLNEEALSQIDLAFFCAGSAISKEWIPKARCLVIDSSSAFRNIAPLIIPEINAHTLQKHHTLIASPNCAATVLLMPLAPLHRLFKVKRIVVSTYQAASGAGAHWVRELENETKAFLEKRTYPSTLPYPYAFNLFPHQSAMTSSGYAEEEMKMLFETRKILEDETSQLSATCIRVPVLRAHSLSANVEFQHPFTLHAVYKTLKAAPGVKLFENTNKFPTPLDATGQDEILCGRFRIDPSQNNTIEFWAVGDQLRKGAALNAVQIAEIQT
jgi:aspartate-semialdehyde dehydrogenase